MVPESLLEVVTPATSFALVDLATLKSDLGIGDTTQDARLTRIIASSARSVAAYVGRPLVEQAYRETWRLPPGMWPTYWATLPRDRVGYLPLSIEPVTVISSVVEAGVTLDPSLYAWYDDKGLLRLDAAGLPSKWSSGTIVVSYKAGWIPIGTTPAPPQIAVPADMYEAALLAARTAFYAKDRDPGLTVRSEAVPDVYQVSYDTRTGLNGDPAGVGTYGLPPAVTAALDAYRRTSFAF
jgi:hypothetical protein